MLTTLKLLPMQPQSKLENALNVLKKDQKAKNSNRRNNVAIVTKNSRICGSAF